MREMKRSMSVSNEIARITLSLHVHFDRDVAKSQPQQGGVIPVGWGASSVIEVNLAGQGLDCGVCPGKDDREIALATQTGEVARALEGFPVTIRSPWSRGRARSENERESPDPCCVAGKDLLDGGRRESKRGVHERSRFAAEQGAPYGDRKRSTKRECREGNRGYDGYRTGRRGTRGNWQREQDDEDASYGDNRFRQNSPL